MFETLQMLFAEQTTADEVIVFLITCVVLSFVFAFLLYGLILALLWRVRLREVTTLRKLLFPGRAQLQRYLGEYVLALTTSTLLTLTVAARHDAVQTVLDYPLNELSTEEIRQAFPFGAVEADELAMAGTESLASELVTLTDERASGGTGTSMALEVLLLPTVAAGGPDNASLWLRSVLGRFEGNPWNRFPTERHLLVASILLLLVYVVWFALGRSRGVESSGDAGTTNYGEIAGRLFVPAVCTALLLVSAASASDLDRIADSAVSAAGLDLDAEEAEAALLFESVMARQVTRGRLVRHLVTGSDSVPSALGAIERLGREVDAVAATTEDLAVVDADARRSIDGLSEQLEILLRDLAAARAQLARDSVVMAGELARLERRADLAEATSTRLAEQLGVAERQSAAAVNRANEAVDAARRLAASIDERLAQLAEQASSAGYLLVNSPGAYRVEPAAGQGRAVAGNVVGLHALDPGTWVVASDFGSQRVAITAGGAATVRIQRQVNIQ